MEENRIKYEYQEDRVLIKSTQREKYIEYLNEKGQEGWELVSYEKSHNDFHMDLYISLFKRLIV